MGGGAAVINTGGIAMFKDVLKPDELAFWDILPSGRVLSIARFPGGCSPAWT